MAVLDKKRALLANLLSVREMLVKAFVLSLDADRQDKLLQVMVRARKVGWVFIVKEPVPGAGEHGGASV